MTGFNIALPVPNELAEYAMRLSQQIASRHETFFVLDNVNFFAHVTLCQLAKHDIKSIELTVQKIAAGTPIFTVTPTRFDSIYGWIGLGVAKTEAIVSLQERIVKDCGLISAEFKPHVTVTRMVKEEKASPVMAALEVYTKPVIFKSIGLYEMGEHGTCTKLLAELLLGVR